MSMLEKVIQDARIEIYRAVGGKNSKRTAESVTHMVVFDVIHQLHRTGHSDAANQVMDIYFPTTDELTDTFLG